MLENPDNNETEDIFKKQMKNMKLSKLNLKSLKDLQKNSVANFKMIKHSCTIGDIDAHYPKSNKYTIDIEDCVTPRNKSRETKKSRDKIVNIEMNSSYVKSTDSMGTNKTKSLVKDDYNNSFDSLQNNINKLNIQGD